MGTTTTDIQQEADAQHKYDGIHESVKDKASEIYNVWALFFARYSVTGPCPKWQDLPVRMKLVWAETIRALRLR